MKISSLSLCFFILASSFAFAQQSFETIKDAGGATILKGIVSKEVLEKEESFSWMKRDQTGYKPDSLCKIRLQQLQDSIYLFVFAGTWCEDTQTILPQFFRLLTESNFSFSRVNILGVDRQKKTTGSIAETMGVFNVPTIIVMKKGKELGRVVEYGKYGKFDRELGEILGAVRQ